MVEEPSYYSLFEQYIAAGMEHSLQSVEADRYRVPEEVRVQAWHLLSFALRTPRAWPVTANLLLALSPKMQQAGFREQWLAYLEQGLLCSYAAGDHQSTAALQVEIGELLRHLGRLAEAKDYFGQALHTFESAGNLLQSAAAKVCLANLAILQEEWSLALEMCNEVLETVLEPHFVRARALFVAADASTYFHEDTEAEQLYSQSQTMWEVLGEPRWAALSLQNRAWLAGKRGDFALARSFYSQVLATFIELEALHGQAIVQMDLGIIEYFDNNFQAALILYQEAERIFRRLNDVRYLAMVCSNIALVFRSSQRWDEAETYYAESVRLLRELGGVLARINTDIGRGKLWLDRGNATKALAHFEQLLVELQQTESNAEHQRLYQEICEYRQQAVAKLALQDEKTATPLIGQEAG